MFGKDRTKNDHTTYRNKCIQDPAGGKRRNWGIQFNELDV